MLRCSQMPCGWCREDRQGGGGGQGQGEEPQTRIEATALVQANDDGGWTRRGEILLMNQRLVWDKCEIFFPEILWNFFPWANQYFYISLESSHRWAEQAQGNITHSLYSIYFILLWNIDTLEMSPYQYRAPLFFLSPVANYSLVRMHHCWFPSSQVPSTHYPPGARLSLCLQLHIESP